MRHVLIALFLIACGTQENPNEKKYTTQLACGVDGGEFTNFKCSDTAMDPTMRSCNGPTSELLKDNPEYFCRGNEFSVSEIEDTPSIQWRFPINVSTPDVRWSNGTFYVPSSQFPLYRELIPFLFWPRL